MQKRKKSPMFVDQLEARMVLSGFGYGMESGYGYGYGLDTSSVMSNATVQADQTKLQTDEQTFQTDQINLATTLLKDQQAIQTAENTAAQPAEATLTKDETTWQTTLQADDTAIASATGRDCRADSTPDRRGPAHQGSGGHPGGPDPAR